MANKKEIEEAKDFFSKVPARIPLKRLTTKYALEYDRHYSNVFCYISQLESKIKKYELETIPLLEGELKVYKRNLQST